MSDRLDQSRTLVAPGELRADLLELFPLEGAGLDLLVAAPGLLPVAPRGHASLARQPHLPLPANAAFAQRAALLECFAAELDALPQEPLWAERVRRWIVALSEGSCRVFHFGRAPLFTRLVSRDDASVVPAGPLTVPLTKARAALDLHLELGGDEHVGARRWFQDRVAEADEISADVRAVLAASWAGELVAPEDLYFALLARYFRATLEGMDVEADDNPMLEVMTEFQAEAYQYAKGILRRFGGVFLADVVGLGKTFIGLSLLRYLQDRHGEHAVVVAPPAVCPAWRDLASEHRVELVTVSHGNLKELESHDDREVLVVDESHNFRHTDTQRYGRLMDWLAPDGVATRKVILVSATPQNNRPRDVLSQLRLFPTGYTPLPYRGETLDAFFKAVERGEHSLTEILQHVVVRRTRHFIRSAYPEARIRRRVGRGRHEWQPLRFPDRVSGPKQTLRYCIEDAYGGGLFDDVMRTIASMTYALYGLGAYVLPEHADDPRVQGIARAGKALRGLMKVLLLKRLESSVEAFRKTLSRLQDRLFGALELLGEGQVRVKVSHRPRTLADDGEADLAAVGDEYVLPASMFDAERLERDLWRDQELVEAIGDAVKRIGPARDAKLRRLERYLRARSPRQHRMLVFTQFADTADYLGARLGQRFGRTHVVTGGSGGALGVVRRFAPVGNRVEVPPEQQIDLLVSTDALSEGVNLQDADTVVNYDLHWNPVRLIQRAGRIDRIGSPNEAIHVASFLPERELEARLNLETVLRRRIGEFLAVFGEDSHVLPSDEALEEAEVLDAYSGKALQDAERSDEMDGLSRHAERILHLRRTDPDRYDRVLALRPGRRALSEGTLPGVAALRLGWFWSFSSWDEAVEAVQPLDDLAGLERFYRHGQAGAEEDVGTRAGALSRFGGMVEAARLAFEPAAGALREQRRQPSLDPTEEWVRRHLERYRRECVGSRVPLVEQMVRWILAGQHKTQVRRSARIWRREGLPAEAVFGEMKGMLRRFPLVEEELGEVEVVGAVMGEPAGGGELADR